MKEPLKAGHLIRNLQHPANRLQDEPRRTDTGFVDDEAVLGEPDRQTVLGIGVPMGSAITPVAKGGHAGTGGGIGAAESIAKSEAEREAAARVHVVDLE